MSKFEIILKEWQVAAAQLAENPWVKRLEKGDLKLCHYKGYLQETYHHAGVNPQIQAYTTMFFKNNPRNTIRKFYKHAISEIGHDLLALNDLVALGENKEMILATEPLPITLAYNSFVLNLVQFHNPVSYLGYLFHLEFLPTQNGPKYIHQLEKLGVPKEALTFLEEHATVDVAHNKLMEEYVEELISTERDLQDVIWAAKSSVPIHSHMISDAFENGERIYGGTKNLKAG